MSLSPADVSALITSVSHLTAAKYYAMASFVMLTYDILLTIPWEVDKIWKKRRFNGLTFLWTLNRWVFWLAVIPTVVSFQDASWVGKVCDGYFRYPGYVAAAQRAVIGIIFILRLYAIYNRSLWAPAVAAIFLTAEIITKLYATVVWGTVVALPPGLPGCILAVSPENSLKFMFFYLTELWSDAVVVSLTVYRSYAAFKATAVRNRTTRLWKVILKDGLAYFAVIFSTNLVTVVMYATATLDLKAINSDFGVMINSIMVARLMLNLKAVASFDEDEHEPGFVSTANATGMHTMTMSRWETAVLGDLGNELSTGWTSEHSRTLRGSIISMESFGKADIDLDGDDYPVSKMHGHQVYTDSPPYDDTPQPGYGSYMYGYSDVEESPRNVHESYPPHPYADSSMNVSRKSRPASSGITNTHAPLIRTTGLTSEPSASEFDAISPTLEGSDMYESFSPPKGSGFGGLGAGYGQHDYMSSAEGSNPYLDGPMEFMPVPPQPQPGGRAPRPLPSVSGRQMGS